MVVVVVVEEEVESELIVRWRQESDFCIATELRVGCGTTDMSTRSRFYITALVSSFSHLGIRLFVFASTLGSWFLILRCCIPHQQAVVSRIRRNWPTFGMSDWSDRKLILVRGRVVAAGH